MKLLRIVHSHLPDKKYDAVFETDTGRTKTVPFGAKGMGEASLLPTAAAIANAIHDAVGIRIKELPITPAKILKALKEKDSNVKA